MKKLKFRLLNVFFVYVLITSLTFLVIYYFNLSDYSFVLMLFFFLFYSALFTVFLRFYFREMTNYLQVQVKSISDFFEKGRYLEDVDPMFQEVYEIILGKSEEIKRLVGDLAETNGIVKSRINEVILSFEKLLQDYHKFANSITELNYSISGINKDPSKIDIGEKLEAFINLTIEISKFKEQLFLLVDKVKEIINQYILRTSEDIKNANMVIKSFLTFTDNLLINLDRFTLYFKNIQTLGEGIENELEKIERHKGIILERVKNIRDNFDIETGLLQEIGGVSKTAEEVFYKFKTLLMGISDLNKKATLMSLNALIYASDSSEDKQKFSVVAKEMKRFVEELDKKYSSMESMFDKLVGANKDIKRLLGDFEKIKNSEKIELSKVFSELEHLNHHFSIVQGSERKLLEPLEGYFEDIENLKEGLTEHSASIKEILTVFREYLIDLEKAEKNKELFDNLVVSSSKLLEYINKELPALTGYISELFKELEDFAEKLDKANKKIAEFSESNSIRNFGKMLEDLQQKRIGTLKDSIILLEKAKKVIKRF